jgi:hypothetical protein
MNEQIKLLFKDFYFIPNTKYPIMVGSMPEKILEELQSFVVSCDQIKNHPLRFLKEHSNMGRNAYQVSVPTHLFENSFFMAFLIHFGAVYTHRVLEVSFNDFKRGIRVRKNTNHFDGYDAWLNYAYTGSENPEHNHAGTLSGVAYIKNTSYEPTVFEDGVEFTGRTGDIILFPSVYMHGVKTKKTDNERITLAFNLDKN